MAEPRPAVRIAAVRPSAVLRPQLGGGPVRLLIEALDRYDARVAMPQAVLDALAEAGVSVSGAEEDVAAGGAVAASLVIEPAPEDPDAVIAAVTLLSGPAHDGSGGGAADGLKLALAWGAADTADADGLTVGPIEWPCAAVLPGPPANVRVDVIPVAASGQRGGAAAAAAGASDTADAQAGGSDDGGVVALGQMQKFSVACSLVDAWGNELLNEQVATGGFSVQLVASARPPWLLTAEPQGAAADSTYGEADGEQQQAEGRADSAGAAASESAEVQITAGKLVSGYCELTQRSKPLRVRPDAPLGLHSLAVRVQGAAAGAVFEQRVPVSVRAGAFPQRAQLENPAPLTVSAGKSFQPGVLLLLRAEGLEALGAPEIQGTSVFLSLVFTETGKALLADKLMPSEARRWKPSGAAALTLALPVVGAGPKHAGRYAMRLRVARADPLPPLILDRDVFVAPSAERPQVAFASPFPASLPRPGLREALFRRVLVSFTDNMACRNPLPLSVRPATAAEEAEAAEPAEAAEAAGPLEPAETAWAGTVAAQLRAVRIGDGPAWDPQTAVRDVPLDFTVLAEGAAAGDDVGDDEEEEDAEAVGADAAGGGSGGAWPAGRTLRSVRLRGDAILPIGQWKLELRVVSPKRWAQAGGGGAESATFVCRANALNARDRARLEASERDVSDGRALAAAMQTALLNAQAGLDDAGEEYQRAQEALKAAEQAVHETAAQRAHLGSWCLPRLLEPLPAHFGTGADSVSLAEHYEKAPEQRHPRAAPDARGARNCLYEKRIQAHVAARRGPAKNVAGLLCEMILVRPPVSDPTPVFTVRPHVHTQSVSTRYMSCVDLHCVCFFL